MSLWQGGRAWAEARFRARKGLVAVLTVAIAITGRVVKRLAQVIVPPSCRPPGSGR